MPIRCDLKPESQLQLGDPIYLTEETIGAGNFNHVNHFRVEAIDEGKITLRRHEAKSDQPQEELVTISADDLSNYSILVPVTIAQGLGITKYP